MRRNPFYHYIVISLILIIFGCTKEPNNIAISSDGVEISYQKQGRGKPALVFVHGWTNNKSIFDAPVSRLSEKYKIVTIDLAGHGASGNNRENWTVSAFGDDVVAVMDKLKIKEAVLIGFSLGAPVIIEAANKVPDYVKGLIFLDDLKNIEMKYPPEMIDYIKNLMMDIVTEPTQEKLVAGGFFKVNPEESYKKVLNMLEGASQVGWEEMIIEYFNYLNEDCIASLQEIQVPIIAINSDSEPTDVDAYRKYVPSFELKVIKNVGHVMWWDAPGEFNRLLEESVQEIL